MAVVQGAINGMMTVGPSGGIGGEKSGQNRKSGVITKGDLLKSPRGYTGEGALGGLAYGFGFGVGVGIDPGVLMMAGMFGYQRPDAAYGSSTLYSGGAQADTTRIGGSGILSVVEMSDPQPSDMLGSMALGDAGAYSNIKPMSLEQMKAQGGYWTDGHGGYMPLDSSAAQLDGWTLRVVAEGSKLAKESGYSANAYIAELTAQFAAANARSEVGKSRIVISQPLPSTRDQVYASQLTGGRSYIVGPKEEGAMTMEEYAYKRRREAVEGRRQFEDRTGNVLALVSPRQDN